MPVKSVLPSSAALQSLFVRSARPIQPIPARVAPRRAVNGSHPSVLSRAHPLGSRLVEQRGQRGQARRHTRTHCIAAMRGTAHAACNTRADSRCSVLAAPIEIAILRCAANASPCRSPFGLCGVHHGTSLDLHLCSSCDGRDFIRRATDIFDLLHLASHHHLFPLCSSSQRQGASATAEYTKDIMGRHSRNVQPAATSVLSMQPLGRSPTVRPCDGALVAATSTTRDCVAHKPRHNAWHSSIRRRMV